MSGNWRDRILRDFPIGAYTLAIACDRHKLFDDPKLRSQLSDRGYKLIFYGEDSIKFRYEYEQHRSQNLPIIAIVPAEDTNILNRFPYDILHRASFRQEYGLNDIFPNLNEIVLEKFDYNQWEQLYTNIQNYPKTQLGEKATEKFLQETFSKYPLTSSLSLTTNPIHQLHSLLKDISNGYQPHQTRNQADHAANDLQLIYAELTTHLNQWQTQPPTYKDWLTFAPLWANAIVSRHAMPNLPQWENQSQLDTLFSNWTQQNYDKLHNLAIGKSPITLHKIPHFLNRQLETNAVQKVALIVFDGMGLDTWLILEKFLSKQSDRQYAISRSASFAMIPTLTSISRQSIFAGKLPKFYAASLNTTSKEPNHWRTFWQEQNFVPEAVAYLNVRGNPDDLEKINNILTHPKQKVLGLVVTKIDDIAHGMALGTEGMHQQTQQWAAQGFFKPLLDLLCDRNYHIYITADHGMIEATGRGRISEGAFVDKRGERVRIYSDEALNQAARTKYPDALFWQSHILPTNCQPLFAPHRIAFADLGDRLMCHGGISIEEVIVPFIEISPARRSSVG